MFHSGFVPFTLALIFVSLFNHCHANASTCPLGSIKRSGKCVPCPPGTGHNVFDNKCEKCPVNTYSSVSGLVDVSHCIPCPTSTRAAPGSTKCLPCPPGHVHTSCGTCIRCSPGGVVSRCGCAKCDGNSVAAGFNTDVDGCRYCASGTRPNKRKTRCVPAKNCPDGTYWYGDIEMNPSGECTPCGFNSFKRGKAMTTCAPCSKLAVGVRYANTRCVKCKPGTYITTETEDFSSVRYFARLCKPCPKGTTTKGFSKTLCTKIAASACPRGTFKDKDGDCNKCPTQYRRDAKSRTCVACPAGSASKGGIGTTCKACGPNGTPNVVDGSTCVCKEGYKRNKKTNKCVPCPAGMYRYGSLVDGEDKECYKCRYDSFSRQGATFCTPCPTGSTSIPTGRRRCVKNKTCPKGFKVPGENYQYPGFNLCVRTNTGCPTNLKVRRHPKYRYQLSCVNKNGKIVCPKGAKFISGGGFGPSYCELDVF